MKDSKKLLPFVKPYVWFALLSPLFMCVEVVMDLLQPTMMQKMIDTGLANEDTGYVLKLGLWMLVSAVVGLVGGLGSSIFAAKAAVSTATDLRREVFTKTAAFSNKNMDEFGMGKLITMLTSDIETVKQAITMTLRIFVRGPLLFIGSIVIVWVTARELFIVLLISIPILMALIYFFSVKSSALFSSVQKAMDQMNTRLQEMLAGIRVIKAFGREEVEKSTFQQVNNRYLQSSMNAEQLVLTLMPMMMFVVNVGIVAGLWLGVIKISEGTIQVGVILAFINYLNIMLNGLMSSSQVIMQIARSFPSASRLVQVLEIKIDITSPTQVRTPSELVGGVEFRSVDFSYSKNGDYVLKDISFKADPGQMVGIIGSTGSGKSTLAKLIPRLYDADHGEVYIDGVNIGEWPLEQVRQSIGVVPQKAFLFSGTIAENLKFGKPTASIQEMIESATASSSFEFIERYDDRFDHELKQGAANLSGGQKQRLSMARAFIRKPKILVLDDSTSAIDALSEAAVKKALKEYYPETTLFLISSKVSSIMEADQILVIEDGRLLASGTHQELLQSSERYRTIYASQTDREVNFS